MEERVIEIETLLPDDVLFERKNNDSKVGVGVDPEKSLISKYELFQRFLYN